MSRWAVRGQCQGRAARSASEARQQERARHVSTPVYTPVSRRWQQRQCNKLRLSYVRPLSLARPKPPPLLRTTEPCLIHETSGDGNCLFRCLSLVLTGSQSYHNNVRQRIVTHISRNCKAFSALLPESAENGSGHTNACAQYLSSSKMATGATWGSDVEILAAAHLLRTRIFVYTMHGPAWQWVEHGMELTDPGRKACKESIYLMHTGLVHYDLVDAVQQCSSSDGKGAASFPGQTQATRQRGKTATATNVKPRNRGCSVPCQGPVAHMYRSNSRSSSSSDASSRSGSASSEGYSSCGESVASSVSRTSATNGATGRKRRTAASASSGLGQRSRRPTSRTYTCNNNNCFCRQPVGSDLKSVTRRFRAISKPRRKRRSKVMPRPMKTRGAPNAKRQQRLTKRFRSLAINKTKGKGRRTAARVSQRRPLKRFRKTAFRNRRLINNGKQSARHLLNTSAPKKSKLVRVDK